MPTNNFDRTFYAVIIIILVFSFFIWFVLVPCIMYIEATIDSTSELSKRLHRHPCNFLFHDFSLSGSHSVFFSMPFFCSTEEKNDAFTIHPLASCDYITYYHFGFSFVLSLSLSISMEFLFIGVQPSTIYIVVFSVTHKYFHLFGLKIFICHSKTFSHIL